MAGRVFPLCTLLGLLSVLLHGASAIDCTAMRKQDNIEYCFVDIETRFRAARGACIAMDAHLARFPDYATAKLVTDGFTTEDVWLDINDIDNEGHFRYSDESDPDWLHWLPGEPSGHGGENCVRFTNRPSSPERSMTDRPCGVSYRYICERELPIMSTLPITTTTHTSTAESTTAAAVPDTTPPLPVTTYGESTSAAVTNDPTTYGNNKGNGGGTGPPVIIGVSVGVAITVVSLIVLSVLCVRARRRKTNGDTTRGIANDTYDAETIPPRRRTTESGPQQSSDEDVIVDNQLYGEADKQYAMIGNQINNNEPDVIKMENAEKETYENWGINGAHSMEGQAPEQIYSKPYPRGGANRSQAPSNRQTDSDDTEDVVVDNQQYATWT